MSLFALLGAGLLLFSAADTYFGDTSLSGATLFLFLLSPWTITYARDGSPEPLLVLWGCLAVFGALRFSKTARLFWAFVCGLALGLAFLTKLWLVLPFALASLVVFAASVAAMPAGVAAAGAFLALFAVIAASTSHLLLAGAGGRSQSPITAAAA